MSKGDIFMDTSSGTTYTITDSSTTTGTIILDNQSTVTITGDIQSGTPEQPVKPTDYSYRDNHYDDEWGSWA